MNNIINLNDKKILKQKICTLTNDEKYSEAIQEGLKILNDKQVSVNNKIVVCYKLAYSYKKNYCFEESIVMINKGLDYLKTLSNEACGDYYYRLLWLKHNCLKELGIENIPQAIKDFKEIKSFYVSIGEVKGANMIGFNIAYWRKDGENMLFYFKRILKSNDISTNVESNHRHYKACEDALLEIEEIDIDNYNTAKTMLKDYICLCS